MKIEVTDFNGAEGIFGGDSKDEWTEIATVLGGFPLHLKASDQAGKKGTPIFDVVGTNQQIKEGLVNRGWKAGLPIPAAYSFLGTDVDFAKREVLGEAQFSNYPFLLNNTVRSELFFKAGVSFTGSLVKVAVIITKAWMFPSSNSTLYYEQGVQQLTELSRHQVFDVPVRLVGLFSEMGRGKAVWTEYTNARYSRTVLERSPVEVIIRKGKTSRSRPTITVV